jgi:hypothetical protein
MRKKNRNAAMGNKSRNQGYAKIIFPKKGISIFYYTKLKINWLWH